MKLKFGPATLVAAAFIGPGTVVTASVTGATFGYALLWALLFAILATLVLQEMAMRIGLVTQRGLGENLRDIIANPTGKFCFIGLVIGAVVVGNGAYQGGNITGASLGADALFGDTALVMLFQHQGGINPWGLFFGLVAALVLWQGKYHQIERFLIGLVILMSLAFLTTFFLSRPDLGELFRGLLIPRVPADGLLTTLALIGTTVVPYALFLHAASAPKRWPAQTWSRSEALTEARADLYTSIPLGGLVTLAIVSTAAAAHFGQPGTIAGAADLAASLEPVFGSLATWLMGLGLMAAGISSAITAPLASAYALTGVLGFPQDLKSWPFRLTWLGIILLGVFISLFRVEPVTLIMFAQVANGILLPLIAGFLLLAVNQRALGQYRNSGRQNLVGGLVFLVSCVLGLRSILLAW